MVSHSFRVNNSHSTSVNAQQAVPGTSGFSGLVAVATTSPVAPPPKIVVAPLPDSFQDAFIKFRERSYDDVCGYFEDLEALILKKSLRVDDVKLISNELFQLLLSHLKESLTVIETRDMKSVIADPKATAYIFDSLRAILESISGVVLEDFDPSVQTLVSWSCTYVCSKILLQAFKLDRYIFGTEIPSRSDINTAIEAAVNNISISFTQGRTNTGNHVTRDNPNVSTYHLASEDDSYRRRKFAEDRISKIEIIDRTPWSGQEDSLKRNYFHFKLRFLDSLELHELFQDPESYFLYFLKNLAGVAKDVVSEHLRESTFTEASAKVQGIWQILESEYNTEFAKREVTKEWRSISQLKDENLSAFANRFLKLQRIYSEATKIYPSDRELMTAFHEGLQNQELKADIIRNVSFETLTFTAFRSEVIRRSQAMADIAKLTIRQPSNIINLNASDSNSYRNTKFNNKPRAANFTYKSPSLHKYSSFNSYNKNAGYTRNYTKDQQECKRCGEKDHFAHECKADNPSKSDSRCQVCASFLHATAQCPIDKRTVSCKRCGTTGHMASICHKKYSDITFNTRSKSKYVNEVEISNHSVLIPAPQQEDVQLPTKTINLFYGDEYAFSALIDSGADLSMIRPDLIDELVRRFDIEVIDLPDKVTVRVADNRKITHCSKVMLRLCISKGSEFVEIPMVVLPSLSRQCILSFDELRKVGIAWIATPSGDRIIRLPYDFDVSSAKVCDVKSTAPELTVKCNPTDVLKRRNSFSNFTSCQATKAASLPSLTGEAQCQKKEEEEENIFESLVEMNRCEVVTDESENFDLFSIKEDPKADPFIIERFKFRIPWKSDSRPSSSRLTAQKLATRLQNELTAKGLFDVYNEEIKNLVKIGAVKEVQDGHGKLYLSHFGVPTKSSSSFGVRPVFNAKPLNKYLRKCKILHKSVLGNIFALRKFKNVRLWDFSKSFYQLAFTDDDSHDVDELVSENNPLGGEFPFSPLRSGHETFPSEYLTFIWNDQEYAFVRVPMGGISSPSHLQRAVEILKSDTLDSLDKNSIDRDSYIINLYMDDGVAGSSSPSVLDSVTVELNKQMSRKSLPDNPAKRFGLVDGYLEIGTERIQVDQNSPVIKGVTGLQWSMTTDTIFSDISKISKVDYPKTYSDFRKLSAMFYDPAGEYLETSLIGRLVLQQALNDEKDFGTVQESTIKLMCKWKDDLSKLEPVPRTLDSSVSDVVFCFADGSTRGIAAVLETLGSTKDMRIMARANLCTETRAPRFELNSMVLACETLSEFIEYGIYKPKLIVVCTDSLVTLSRLKNEGKRKECGVFEFNRFIKIRDSLRTVMSHGCRVIIRHIAGAINPADSLSRILPPDLSIRDTLHQWKIQSLDNFSHDKNGSFHVFIDKDWLQNLEQEMQKRESNNSHKVEEVASIRVSIDKDSFFQTAETIALEYYKAKLLKKALASWVSSHESGELPGYSSLNLSPLNYLIFRAQNNNGQCKEIIKPLPASFVKQLRSRNVFSIDDGKVYKRFADRWVLFVPDSESELAKFVVKFIHSKCHGSSKFVEKEIRKWYAIRNLTKLVNSSKSKCHYCLCSTDQRPSHFSSSTIKPMSNTPWSYVGIDFVGPFPQSTVNRVVLVLTCMLSGFIKAVPLPSCDTVNTVRALEDAFWDLGFPTKVRVDNGAAFTSRAFVEYITLRGIHLTYSVPYHPSSNGKLEASHRSLNNFIRTLTFHKFCNWSNVVKEAQLLANNKVILGGLCPFELMHTYSSRLPYFDNWSSAWQPRSQVEDSRGNALKNLKEFLDLDAEKAREKSASAVNSRSLQQQHKIHVGDTVYKRKFNRNKLTPYFSGPFTVISIAGGLLALRGQDGKQSLTHVENVKHIPNSSTPETTALGEPFEIVKNRILAQRFNLENDTLDFNVDRNVTESSISDLDNLGDDVNGATFEPDCDSLNKLTDIDTTTPNRDEKLPKLLKKSLKSIFPLNASVRWTDATNAEHSGQVVELKPGIAVVHRHQSGTDDVLSFISYGDKLHPDLCEVDLSSLRRLLPNRRK